MATCLLTAGNHGDGILYRHAEFTPDIVRAQRWCAQRGVTIVDIYSTDTGSLAALVKSQIHPSADEKTTKSGMACLVDS